MVLFRNRAKQVNGYGKKSSMKNFLQVYAGSKWHDISTRTVAGLKATGCVGNLTVSP